MSAKKNHLAYRRCTVLCGVLIGGGMVNKAKRQSLFFVFSVSSLDFLFHPKRQNGVRASQVPRHLTLSMRLKNLSEMPGHRRVRCLAIVALQALSLRGTPRVFLLSSPWSIQQPCKKYTVFTRVRCVVDVALTLEDRSSVNGSGGGRPWRESRSQSLSTA